MKQIQFSRTGIPSEVVECVEVDDPVISALGDVRVRIETFPINPADLLTLQGYYPRSNPDSRTLGVEALGCVEAVGPSVTDLAPGDRVIPLTGDNWTERKVMKTHELLRVSPTLDPLRAASLKVNPATAHLLLTAFVGLKPGDWFLQNAANSAVGRAVIQIAHNRGIRTLNIIRRADDIPELKMIGADVVLLDSDDLPRRVTAATGGAEVRLAADAVAGSATNRLASCLAEKGTLVVYGAMSGEAAMLNPGLAVFQDISFRGFWLTRYLATADRPDVARLYGELQGLAESGTLIGSVDSVFAADEIKAAVKRASERESKGKIFVRFGP
jgi:trans-2-enoyl-CoA reductase